jgi:amidase/aspartyl-tRNA(Asn)/glutamyl-tRNA(Gln) amidotransferase subunit A
MTAAMAALVGLAPPGPAPRGAYLEMPGVDRDVAQACQAAALAFTEPADEAVRRTLQEAFSPAAEVYGVLAGVETWKLHRKWADRYRARYGPLVQDRLDRARAISPAQVAAVDPSQATLVKAWNDYFASHDFLVMPAAPCAALGLHELTSANRLRMLGLTAPASLGGLPALTIPVALPSGLSAGLQVVFRRPESPVVAWVLGLAAHSSA